MHRINDDSRTYRHKHHTIERLPSRVIGPDGAYHWLVIPDHWGESWYSCSLLDACDAIDAEMV